MTRRGYDRKGTIQQIAKGAKVTQKWLAGFDDLELTSITPTPGIQKYIHPGDGWRLIGQITEALELGINPTAIIAHKLDADEARRYIAAKLAGANDAKALACAREPSQNILLECFIRLMLGQLKASRTIAFQLIKRDKIDDLLSKSSEKLSMKTAERAKEIKDLLRKNYGDDYEKELLK